MNYTGNILAVQNSTSKKQGFLNKVASFTCSFLQPCSFLFVPETGAKQIKNQLLTVGYLPVGAEKQIAFWVCQQNAASS
jgi:hypothetical protein